MFTTRLLAQRPSATAALARASRLLTVSTPARSYYKDNVLMPREKGEYYADPMDVAERVVRLVALHDSCNDPAAVTLGASFG
mmetsp:Transcript_44514/g.59059  ORF Transcript_44514/g.59059 Transcript_44514/m.59059 type:complete len:82 (+) Transcript_44514:1428-1673(+)|eukprot:CAMPEP_0185568296 /NCGR_PEP_ID=MMETSP0434-20130131/1297_1 /TAXON_ID=626734 ORGANISM="Favella taraikaensis, Strain Fe Narragansett Bay" /NCGR_SAMPLE_ID=MMETSP0434 /ASSEMBLY_ACC=CAM_ASM_000379 /LENGTH=81 /DNA_ID=CAMNT_0028182767 /DNA_START=1428 /DNA_END=1673 /DNA_ORIENTATION=+